MDFPRTEHQATLEFLRNHELLHDKIRLHDLPYPNHSATGSSKTYRLPMKLVGGGKQPCRSIECPGATTHALT